MPLPEALLLSPSSTRDVPPVLLHPMEDEELDEILVNTVDVIPLLAV